MIPKFEKDTALLLIDVQRGVDDLSHWGGPAAERNNLEAEDNMAALLGRFRKAGLKVVFTQHDSREAASPLKIGLPSGAFKDGFLPSAAEIVIRKDVNSSFIGTDLELELQRARINRLVVAGFFTNFCVETTVRMAGNMGYDTYLVEDACSTTNRVAADGTIHPSEVVHRLSVASMDGEFCTAIRTKDAISLTRSAAGHLARRQGNE